MAQMLMDDAARIFNKQLEYVVSEIYKVEYRDLVYRQMFPISSSVPPGTKTITRQHYDGRGKAVPIVAAAQDLPRADVSGGETSWKVRKFGASFGYDLDEVAAAALAGVNLNAERAEVAMRALNEKMEYITFYGDADLGLTGLFSDTDIPDDTVAADGTGDATTWATKTPDKILRDVNDLCSAREVATKSVERGPVKLALPVQRWNYIFSTPRASGSDMSIGTWLAANSPFINSPNDIIKLDYLLTSGAASAAQMLIYDPNPKKVVLEIVQDIKVLPPQERNLGFVVPMYCEFSSLHILKPLSMRFGTGI
jgi:hypothetical protein